MASFLNFPILNNEVKITLHDFLNNPAGKGTSMMGKREEIKKNLNLRYYELLKKYQTFKYDVYNDKDSYFFYFKIPSESYDEIKYDVVLEFIGNKKNRDSANILDYSMHFFSNSPHMTFTYTYSLNQNGLLVRLLKDTKYSKDALKYPPKIRNPYEMFGFEKSCYYAALFISEYNLYLKDNISAKLTKITGLTRGKLLNSIMSQESKLQEYNLIKRRYSEEKRKQKEEDYNKDNDEFASDIKSKANKRINASKKQIPVNTNKKVFSTRNKLNMQVNSKINNKANMTHNMKLNNRIGK